MILSILAIPFSLFLIVKSADHFVGGSAIVAKKFGISPFVIGVVIVGFGTSAPELVVSAFAAFEGQSGIALGNAYGSNFTNIALILGLTAFILPITITGQILKREIPVLLAMTVASGLFLLDRTMDRLDGIVLLFIFSAIMLWTLRDEVQHHQEPIEDASPEKSFMKKAYLQVFFGLVVLLLSSRLFVWGAVNIASFFGVSELVIGLTVVAIGTSLPELASSVQSARRGDNDIALGNILGSNLFNTLMVVGVASLIRPLQSTPEVLKRDLPAVFIVTALLILLNVWKKTPKRMGRIQGTFFVLLFASYVILLFKSS